MWLHITHGTPQKIGIGQKDRQNRHFQMGNGTTLHSETKQVSCPNIPLPLSPLIMHNHSLATPYHHPLVHFERTARKYRVILKKVSFGIFRIILVSKEEKKFTAERENKGLSLTKFS